MKHFIFEILLLTLFSVHAFCAPPAYLPPGEDQGQTGHYANCTTTTYLEHQVEGNHCQDFEEVMTGIEQTTPTMIIDCARMQTTCDSTHSNNTQDE